MDPSGLTGTEMQQHSPCVTQSCGKLYVHAVLCHVPFWKTPAYEMGTNSWVSWGKVSASAVLSFRASAYATTWHRLRNYLGQLSHSAYRETETQSEKWLSEGRTTHECQEAGLKPELPFSNGILTGLPWPRPPSTSGEIKRITRLIIS